MAADPLPDAEQCRLLGEVLAAAFSEVRELAREAGVQRIEELADALHNVPTEMFGKGRWSIELTRGLLANYGQKYSSRRCLYEFEKAFPPDSER